MCLMLNIRAVFGFSCQLHLSVCKMICVFMQQQLQHCCPLAFVLFFHLFFSLYVAFLSSWIPWYVFIFIVVNDMDFHSERQEVHLGNLHKSMFIYIGNCAKSTPCCFFFNSAKVWFRVCCYCMHTEKERHADSSLLIG